MGKSPYVHSGIHEAHGDNAVEQNPASAVTTLEISPETPEEKQLDAMAQVARKRNVNIKQTRMNGKATEATENPSFIPPAHPAAILIDSIVNNPDFDIVAGQVSPHFKRDIPIPKMKVADLRSYLENELGGGVFVIQVRHNGTDVEDDKHGVLKLTVPVKPKVEVKEADAVSELAAKRKELAEKRRLEQEAAELEAEREERQRKKNANPELEKQLVEMRQKYERLEEERRQAQLAAAAAPKESGMDQLVKLTPLIAALAPLFKREPDHSMAEAIKENGRVMERVATALQMSQKETMQTMKEMNAEQLAILKEASKKEDPIDALRKVLALKKELSPEESVDGQMFNPKYGWHNAWLLAGELMEGIGQHIAPVMQIVMDRFNRQPDQVTEPEVLQLAKELVDRKKRGLPMPWQQKRPALPQKPAQQKPATKPATNVVPIATNPTTGPDVFEVLNETAPVEEAKPAATPQPTPSVASDITSPPQAAAGEQEIKAEVDLRIKIEESIDDMLDDINLGRALEGKLNWTDNANVVWPREFRAELCQIQTPVRRMQLVKSKVPPEIWLPIDESLAKVATAADAANGPGSGQYVFNNFYNSFAQINAE